MKIQYSFTNATVFELRIMVTTSLKTYRKEFKLLKFTVSNNGSFYSWTESENNINKRILNDD